ncbi:PAS domain S-box protein [Phenylobacterium sp.]|uniref:PAS domain S-box protein n=1 Tax=Phenylobacterium sp. TaxID=1871053 RepID=UPI0035B49CFB
MTIAGRITLSTVAVILLTALVLALAVDFGIRRSLTRSEFERQQAFAERLAADLNGDVRGMREDAAALVLATPAAELLTAPGGAQRDRAKDEVLRAFRAELAAKPRYLQLRIIGEADGGREVVRVERSGEGEPVRTVADADLQPKGDRPYFTDTVSLPQGGIYVSPLELNREHGQVQTPHMPVVRAGAPVYSPDGRAIGALVVNVDMRSALEHLRAGAADGAYLVDTKGDYLILPDRKRDFGFELGPAKRLQDDFPGLAAVPAAAKPLSMEIKGPTGEQLVVAAAPVSLGGGPRVVVVTMTPSDRAAATTGAGRAIVIASLFAALLGAVAAVLVARSVSRPLVQITEAAKGFMKAGDLDLPKQRIGEVGVLADTLEHMHATIRERTAAQQRLAAIVTSTDDAILSKDLSGRITSWNHGAEVLFGYDEAEAVGQPMSLIIPPSLADEERRLVERIGRGERIEHFETRRQRRDGSEVEVSVALSPLRDAQGRIVGASSINRDITELRRAAAELAQQEHRLRQVIDASASAMLMVDNERTIQLANTQAETLFGYPREELVGQKIEMLVPPAHRGEHPEHVSGFFAKPEARAMGSGRELFGLRGDGSEVPVEIGLNPIEMAEGVFTLASIIDITERKRHEDELRRSNAELEQFAYIASHDLQEPLRMVASYTELLAARYSGKLDEKADKYIHYASDGARRMQQLITDLLAYSRVGSQGKPLAPVDSQAVVSGVAELFTARLEELGGEVEVENLPLVMADEGQLRQLFQNLIGNAIKFRGEAPPKVVVTARRERGRWAFSVKDNGIGLDMRHASRIFDMFQRLHERGKFEGSGIGLAIAKRIVERHGGRLWLDSEPGKGATFFFTLQAA